MTKPTRTVAVKPINWLKEFTLIICTGGLWSLVTIGKLINRAATR